MIEGVAFRAPQEHRITDIGTDVSSRDFHALQSMTVSNCFTVAPIVLPSLDDERSVHWGEPLEITGDAHC